MKGNGYSYLNIYAHLTDLNIVILEYTRPEAATLRGSLNIWNYTKNHSAQGYL